MNETQQPATRPKPLYFPVFIMCAGALLAGFGLLGSIDPDNPVLDGKPYWFMFAAGCSVIGLGWFGLSECWKFGLLVFALFIGGAAQLWLTEPLWFPALRLGPDSSGDIMMMGLIAFQGLVTAFFLLSRDFTRGLGNVISKMGLFRRVVFLALSALFVVSPLGYLSYGGYFDYVTHIIGGGAMIGLNLCTIAAMLGTDDPGLGKRTFHPLVPAGIAMLVSGLLAWFAFERLPHVEDEVAFLFQAKTFAGGALSVPALPEATRLGLEHYLLDVRDGRWFSTTPPGWPALLTVGILIGAPWIINPLLAFVCVLLAHNITLRLSNRSTAQLVALLMAASPWLLGTAGSMMPHMITLTLTLFAWWALLISRAPTARVIRWSLAAGLAMGWIFATRQLEALILGTLTGLWLLTLLKERQGIARVLFYGAGCIAAGSLYLLFNYAMTGDPLLDPLKRYLDESWGVGGNAYGFGPDIGPPGGWGSLDLAEGHSVFEGFINFVNNMSALSIEFLGWGVGSLALFWAYLLYARPTRFELAMATVAALMIAALFLYWFSGSFYIGPRYWFSAFFPLLVFSAKGFQILRSKLAEIGVPTDRSGVVLLVLCAYSLTVFTSWRGVEKYYEYNTFNSAPRTVYALGEFENAIIFFDPETVDPGSALNENDPWQREGSALFIRDMGAEINTEVINALPGRTVVYLNIEK